jgi:hypothetical protein
LNRKLVETEGQSGHFVVEKDPHPSPPSWESYRESSTFVVVLVVVAVMVVVSGSSRGGSRVRSESRFALIKVVGSQLKEP